jgi:hypothetical protein
MQRPLIILILFLVLLAIPGFSQSANNLAVDATVKDQDGGRLSGVQVELYENGALVNKVMTGKNGRFDLLLDFGFEYMIKISKKGFVAKKLEINTERVPAAGQDWGYEFGGFVVDLFSELDGFDYSILDKPIAKVYFDPNLDYFKYDEIYTKQIQAEVDRMIAEYKERLKLKTQLEKLKETDFQLAMKDAENALIDGNFIMAKENFLAASSIKPGDPLPKAKIAEIDKKMAAAANTEDKYLSILATADQLYGTKKYTEAKAKYTEALALMPAEEYPQKQLAACDKAQAALLAAQKADVEKNQLDGKYKAELEKGDLEFAGKNYQNAKVSYQNAVALKPDETYPKERLTLIETRFVDLANADQKAKELAAITEKYNAQIAKADAAFASANFESAMSGYLAASAIKSDGSYPKDQIALIEQKMQELAVKAKDAVEKKRIDAEYQALILQGSKDYDRRNYEIARDLYASALKLKPQETLPKERIEQIEKLLSNMAAQRLAEDQKKAQEGEYAGLIAQGDASFKLKDFDASIKKYEAALVLKPKDPFPKDQIDKVKAAKAQAETPAVMQKILAEADATFQQQSYEESRSLYTKYLGLKVGDKYAQSQVSEIDRRIFELDKNEKQAAENAEIDLQYNELLKAGDALFASKAYTSAISEYEKAIIIKPSESYPKSKIEEARKRITEKETNEAMLAEQAAVDQKYQAKIELADAAFNSENFDGAIESYNLAAGIKPNETYPSDQIAMINAIKKDRADALALAKSEENRRSKEAETERLYEIAIKEADGLMDSEDYIKARTKYQTALALKERDYPANQIITIERLIQEKESQAKSLAGKQVRYDEFMSACQNAIADKNWELARSSCGAASELLPEEQLPKSRLSEIDQLEKNHQVGLAQIEFELAVSKADDAFLRKNYEKALSFYDKALGFKPDNVHCMARKIKIHEILNAPEEVKEEEKLAERKVEEETKDEGNAKITIRKVTVGEKVDVYKKVIYSWGGKYYFLNDQPVTELVWTRETAQ